MLELATLVLFPSLAGFFTGWLIGRYKADTSLSYDDSETEHYYREDNS
jgi:hypothetical protein